MKRLRLPVGWVSTRHRLSNGDRGGSKPTLPNTLAWLIVACLAGCAARPAASSATRRQTDRDLDLAIDGDGYFIVQTTAGGFLFTRVGELAVSSDGELVNGDGYKMYPPVPLPTGSGPLTISPDGVVRRQGPQDTAELLGQIVLSRFERPAGLERDGIYFLPTAASGDPITGKPGTKGLGTLRVGELEQ